MEINREELLQAFMDRLVTHDELLDRLKFLAELEEKETRRARCSSTQTITLTSSGRSARLT